MNLSRRLPLLVSLFLLLAPHARASARSSAAPPAPDPEVLRQTLLERINAERRLAGTPPLRAAAALDKVAQLRAEEIAASGLLPGDTKAPPPFGRIDSRLTAAGYRAHGWTEDVTVTSGTVDAVIAYWKQSASYPEAMRADFEELGVGVATMKGVPLYTFLLAWPESEMYRREVAALGDLTQVRDAMLVRVNLARKAAGRPPLAADPRLDTAAQAHAEDMLKRTFYSHRSPEGTTALERVRTAGYPATLAGENIAARHLTVDEAMDAWLDSAGHRRNILEPRFTHLGVGLAIGEYEHRYQLLWVQEFGRL